MFCLHGMLPERTRTRCRKLLDIICPCSVVRLLTSQRARADSARASKQVQKQRPGHPALCAGEAGSTPRRGPGSRSIAQSPVSSQSQGPPAAKTPQRKAFHDTLQPRATRLSGAARAVDTPKQALARAAKPVKCRVEQLRRGQQAHTMQSHHKRHQCIAERPQLTAHEPTTPARSVQSVPAVASPQALHSQTGAAGAPASKLVQPLDRSPATSQPDKGSASDATLPSNAARRNIVQSLQQMLADLGGDALQPHSSGQNKPAPGSFAASVDSLAQLEAEIAVQHQRLLAAGVRSRSQGQSLRHAAAPCSAQARAAAGASTSADLEAADAAVEGSNQPNGDTSSPNALASERTAAAASTGIGETSRPKFSYPPDSLLRSNLDNESADGSGQGNSDQDECEREPSTSVEDHLKRLGLSVRCGLALPGNGAHQKTVPAGCAVMRAGR